jgi:hypothetical protein
MQNTLIRPFLYNGTYQYFMMDEDFLDQFQILWSGGIAVAPPDLLAQSFKPSENMISRIELLVHKTHEPLDELTVSIRETLDGPDLTTASLPPQSIPENRGWVEFDFEDVPVLINKTYYIVWQPQGESMAYIWWGYDNHNYDSYPRGEAWLYTNGQWTTEGFVIKDWCFRTYAYHLSQSPFPPYRPIGPTEGSSYVPYQYQTVTTDPDGDDVRYGWDWNGDDIVDEWTTRYASGVTINASHAWSSLGTYTVQVKAEDEYGFLSNFSESLMVTISNDPPLVPSVPVGPVVGLSWVEYEYRVNTSDPDGDDVRYGWDWDGDDVVDEWTELYHSGVLAAATHNWTSAGTYHLKVKAKDAKGAQSNFSQALKIIIVSMDNEPPNQPQRPAGPSSGKIGFSYSYSSSTTDPDGDTVYYMVDWDDGTTSGWKGPYNSGQSFTISHIWEAKGTYQIKVKAKDEHDIESIWSEPLSINMPKSLTRQTDYFIEILASLTDGFPLVYYLFHYTYLKEFFQE